MVSDRTASPPDAEQSGTTLWSTPEWRAGAVAWLDEQLSKAGMTRIGDAEQPHLRPWATALAVQTDRGKVWLKAACPGTRFEIALYPLLARAAPRWVLEPIAVDTDRGWIVLPDGGTVLGDAASGDELASALARVLPAYAELQRALIPHAAELIAQGVADMRAAVMPARFDEALHVVRSYVDAAGDPADADILRRVEAQRSTYVTWCRELQTAPVPPSLDHNDLHPWNIFVAPQGAITKFYDWGDSVVAHPFASLLVGLGFMRRQLQLQLDDPRVLRARDAYLEVFDDLAPRPQLVQTLELACRVAKIARVLTWHRAIALQTAEEAAKLARVPLSWLASVLDSEYLGPRG